MEYLQKQAQQFMDQEMNDIQQLQNKINQIEKNKKQYKFIECQIDKGIEPKYNGHSIKSYKNSHQKLEILNQRSTKIKIRRMRFNRDQLIKDHKEKIDYLHKQQLEMQKQLEKGLKILKEELNLQLQKNFDEMRVIEDNFENQKKILDDHVLKENQYQDQIETLQINNNYINEQFKQIQNEIERQQQELLVIIQQLKELNDKLEQMKLEEQELQKQLLQINQDISIIQQTINAKEEDKKQLKSRTYYKGLKIKSMNQYIKQTAIDDIKEQHNKQPNLIV
ncbi:hypothetical protein pb186bvf_006316 [Paramecium bursaria]